jgi:hypothetical protein
MPMWKHNYISKILSYILHPIFIPIYVTFLYIRIFKNVITYDISEYLLSVVGIGTLLLPLSTILLLKKIKLIDSIHLKKSKERIIPILSTAVYLYITAKLLMTGNINSPLNSYLIGVVVTLTWILIFTRRMKVSLHTSAISSALGFFIYLSHSFLINLQSIIVITTITIGIVATARIKLKAHTCKEIAVGVIFGLIPQLGYIYLY